MIAHKCSADAHITDSPGSDTDPPCLPHTDNEVKRFVDRFRQLTGDIEEDRKALQAYGIPPASVRNIVQHALKDRSNEQAAAIREALDIAEALPGNSHGSRQSIEQMIDRLVVLELEMDSARGVAKDAGLDPKILMTLLQLIQRSPGDYGSTAINTLIAYAMACGVQFDKAADIADQVMKTPASVLPQVQRTVAVSSAVSHRLALDAVLGLFIGIVVIWLVK